MRFGDACRRCLKIAKRAPAEARQASIIFCSAQLLTKLDGSVTKVPWPTGDGPTIRTITGTKTIPSEITDAIVLCRATACAPPANGVNVRTPGAELATRRIELRP